MMLTPSLKSWIVLGSICLFSCCLAKRALADKEIALSFDDAPRGSTAMLGGLERTKQLIFQLHVAKVFSVAFFCNTDDRLEHESGRARLRLYGEAGHIIANHTSNHRDLHKISTDDFIEDIDKAHSTLSPMLGFRPFFRFPFLREGNSLEKRDKVRRALNDRSLKHGYVTVDTSDWYLDALVQRNINQGRWPNFGRLSQVYVEMLMDDVNFYEDLSRKLFNRDVRQVILLHENDLAAYFIGDLVRKLKKDGWKIIPFSVACNDPIAILETKTLTANQGKIHALAVDMKYEGKLYPKYVEESEIDKLVRERNVFASP